MLLGVLDASYIELSPVIRSRLHADIEQKSLLGAPEDTPKLRIKRTLTRQWFAWHWNGLMHWKFQKRRLIKTCIWPSFIKQIRSYNRKNVVDEIAIYVQRQCQAAHSNGYQDTARALKWKVNLHPPYTLHHALTDYLPFQLLASKFSNCTFDIGEGLKTR